MKNYIVAGWLLVFGWAMAEESRATLIAYDGFASTNYTVGALLNQNPAIAGFNGVWTPGNNIAAGGTTYALVWTGMATDDSGGAYSTATGNLCGRDIAAPLGPPTGGGTNTFYVSILMQNSLVATSYRAFELYNFGNRNLQIGANSDIDGTGQRWGMRALNNAALRATSTVAAVANETVLAVLKITCSSVTNSDAVRLWINPIDISDEGASTNFVELTGLNFIGNSTNNFNNFRFSSFSGTSVGCWDELRIGTTWGSVLPAPQIPTYTVTYLGNGNTAGTPPTDANAYEEDEEVTVLGANTLVRTNHDFGGWNTAVDGTGTAYDPDDTFSMGTLDVVLYAQWTKIPPGPGFYEVIYDGNGNTGGLPPEDLAYYEEDDVVTVLNQGSLTRTGYAFDGWNTADDDSGDTYQPADTFAMGTANVTLYARWQENPTTGVHVRVFVLAGQSNMRGLGRINQAPAEWRPLTSVLFDDTVPGTPESFSSAWGEMGAVDDDMGPEMGFAAVMREAYPDDRIAIVKVSQSGTGLNFWRTPGQGGHDTLMARIATVRDWLDDAVAENGIPSWSFEGFIWMQGENEANSIESVALAYQADFDDLSIKVRNQIGNTNLPVVLGRISIQLDPSLGGPVQQPQLDYVRAGQVAWATNDANGGWVNTDDLTLIDNWHFGSYGTLLLGQRFAETWFAVAEPRPRLSLRRASTQPAKSFVSNVVYDAVFSEAVTGFTAGDVAVLGDTGADLVTVEELAPLDGTTYRITVSGMLYPGTVDIRVPVAAAAAGGLDSLPGLAEDTRVLYANHAGVANLLLHDPFTSQIRPLHRLQQGVGWDGAGWQIQNGLTNGFVTAVSNPLGYGDLFTSPAYASGGDAYSSSARLLDLEKTFADYMTSRGANAIDVPGTTLWLSYLIRPIDIGQRQRVALMRGTAATFSDGDNMLRVEQNGGIWQFVALNNAVSNNTGVAALSGSNYLMVLRLHIGGASDASTAHLWINPSTDSLGGADPELATATSLITVTNTDFKFRRIYWYPGQAVGNGMLDEIRLGTTFASVTPVPVVTEGELDTDGDGIPDWWEELYFGSATGADANAPATNGVNTVLECYIAGLDPLDERAVFSVSGGGGNQPGYVIEWTPVSGRVYQVFWSTNLMQEPAFTQVVPSFPWPQSSFTDTVHQSDAAIYYRLKVGLEAP